MAGTILRIAKSITSASERMLINAYNGDIEFNSAGKVNYNSKQEVVYGDHEKIDPNKKIVNAIWIDAETNEEIKQAYIGQEVNILVQTLNYEQGESISLKVEDKTIINGCKEVFEKEYTGKVGSKGIAILEENILIE